MRHDLPQVQWGPTVSGALLAVAIAIVLGLFGVAFGIAGQAPGSQGLGVLGGVWKILTPLVATFVGSALTASMVGKRSAFLNGVMVWCITLAFAVAVTGGVSAMGLMPRTMPMAAGGASLLGLAAILGFVGALGGAIAGAAADQRRAAHAAELAPGGETRRAGARADVQPSAAARGTAPGEPPELRH